MQSNFLGLCLDAHLNHVRMHLLSAALVQENIGPSSIGPETGAARFFMHGLEAALLRQMGIHDEKAGTLFILHLEKNSLVVGYLDCSRAAELHLVQLWGQTGRPRKNACAPVKNLLPIGTVDLQSRSLAQEGTER